MLTGWFLRRCVFSFFENPVWCTFENVYNLLRCNCWAERIRYRGMLRAFCTIKLGFLTLFRRFGITLQQYQTPYLYICPEAGEELLQNPWICCVRLLFWSLKGLCSGEMDRKSNRNRIYPSVETFCNDPVMRECADGIKKRKVIVTGGHFGTFSLLLLKTVLL